MHIQSKYKGTLTENDVTDKELFLNRRTLIKSMGLATIGSGITGLNLFSKPVEGLSKNSNYSPELELTNKEDFLAYNNFYEFSFQKHDVKVYAKNMKTSPWEVTIDGLVNNPMKIDFADILKKYPQEERIYRFRCVETWSAIVPWAGFPLSKLLKDSDPKSEAKYVAFETFHDPEVAINQRSRRPYKWPYTEGLRLDEAMHDLTLVGTGLYGEHLENQNGAPIRIVVPWKYGFKSIKSIVKITLTNKEPPTLWNNTAPSEYGFYANVNPEVDHPRWSQATEKLVGSFFGRNKTLLFNGYKEVADLYKGMDLSKYF